VISEKKKYIIELFLKKCTLQSINKAHMDFSFQLMTNTYIVSKETLSRLKDKYNIDAYIERIIPLIDEQFTIEELQEAIRFYSSVVGRKMMDSTFLQKIGKIGTRMFTEIEQDFALNQIK
jgi:hypothetical protein